MIKKEGYSSWLFIVFPSITMLLGWGLRGHIGGGPFGAMIPGALVALSLSMLLELPAGMASVFVVFGVVGIGLGGEMTYGQTLGFLKNADTQWWGTLGITVKGAIWGLLGGIVLGMGLIYNRLPKKTIIIGFLLLFAGMLAGFKLINQPMVIYFSDHANPRSESWGALLVGAIALLIFLKSKIETAGFKIISRFALWGLIGGGLGFGLGGFWMVLGFHLPGDVIFQSWWKAMEFTFGLLLGGALGYSAWLSRKEILRYKEKLADEPISTSKTLLKEFTVTLIAGLLIYWGFSSWLDPIVEAGKGTEGFSMIGLRDFAILLSNFAFFGLIMILAVMRFPSAAWQIAITLTFCHAAINLISDFYPETTANSPFTVRFVLILLMTTIVALLTAFFQQRKNILHTLFLLLVWSTVTISFLRLFINPESLNISGLSFCKIVCGKFIVDIIFLVSALIVSFISFQKIRQPQKS
ncbi:MAG: hypothetical protein WC865_17235 [Bacteroidales bacterium]